MQRHSARLLALGLAFVVAPGLAMTGDARANGRYPAQQDVMFRPGSPDWIYSIVTFGMIVSSDDGASFRWICEEAIPYGGTYDPDYAVLPDGTIYATTYDGLRVTHDDGCTWNDPPAPVAGLLPAQVERGGDGAIWLGLADPDDKNVYVSRDGGASFEVTTLGGASWWNSIAVAPSDPQRVYVSGYKIPTDGSDVTHVIYRTIDGGATWEPISVAPFIINIGAKVFVDAISPTNPDVVYVRVTRTGDTKHPGNAIYRSTNGGESFEKIYEVADELRVLQRADGQVIIGSKVKGSVVSPSGDPDSFVEVASPPEVACLREREDGTLFVCGSNWKPDNFAIARSTTFGNWQPVMAFVDMVGPVACPAGTPQHDTCQVRRWCSIEDQFQIDGHEIDCTIDAGVVEPGVDAADPVHTEPGGCCSAGGAGAGAGAGAGLLGLAVAAMLWPGRRRRGRMAR
jgi:hypothetical protein